MEEMTAMYAKTMLIEKGETKNVIDPFRLDSEKPVFSCKCFRVGRFVWLILPSCSSL